VTNRGIDDRERERLLAVEPERLSRDALIRLVRDLQSAMSGGAAPDIAATRKRPPATTVAGADYTLIFDGGSLGNPGLGYGSYEIAGNGETTAAQRLEFGNNMTNNQAEFHALIAGLEELLKLTGPKAKSVSIAIRGDSQLVIRGLTGEWRVKHPGLQPLHRQANALLEEFGSVDIAWHPRSNSVRTFGH
jgi:ribonuclease HI